MNVEIGTLAAQFLFWEYLFNIVGIQNKQQAKSLQYCYYILHARVIMCMYE
jgi:hypothetical protein